MWSILSPDVHLNSIKRAHNVASPMVFYVLMVFSTAFFFFKKNYELFQPDPRWVFPCRLCEQQEKQIVLGRLREPGRLTRKRKRKEWPVNVALWFLHWSGCIWATCWWHDWSISPCLASAPLITLLNVATGEPLLEAAVTLPEQWCTLAPPFKPFFLDISTFEWATREAIQWEHAPGLLGGLRLSRKLLLMDCESQPIDVHELGDQRKVRQRCPAQEHIGHNWTKADCVQPELFDYQMQSRISRNMGLLLCKWFKSNVLLCSSITCRLRNSLHTRRILCDSTKR